MHARLYVYQGISALTVQVSQINIMPDDYTLVITNGEIVHIGESISNLSLSVGDTHITSADIMIADSSVSLLFKFVSYTVSMLCVFFVQTITIQCGQSIVNAFDNLVDSGDEIIVNVEAYVSNNGTGLVDQVRLQVDIG